MGPNHTIFDLTPANTVINHLNILNPPKLTKLHICCNYLWSHQDDIACTPDYQA
jgi:hypothetical protein